LKALQFSVRRTICLSLINKSKKVGVVNELKKIDIIFAFEQLISLKLMLNIFVCLNTSDPFGRTQQLFAK
jgi:hypothetical protein